MVSRSGNQTVAERSSSVYDVQKTDLGPSSVSLSRVCAGSVVCGPLILNNSVWISRVLEKKTKNDSTETEQYK
jgi:hypothetical protein